MTHGSHTPTVPQPPAPGQYAPQSEPYGQLPGGPPYAGQPSPGQPTPTQEKSGKNKGLIIAASVMGALALVLGGMAIASDDPGIGTTTGPVVTEPAPAPTPTDTESTSGATDLGGLSAAEEQAILFVEDYYGIDLNADGEAALLHDAYICIDQYEAGWSFDAILSDNLYAYEGNEELSATVMVVGFEFLAPQHTADFEAWLGI